MTTPVVLVVEHEAACPPAHVGRWLEEAGCSVELCRPYDGDPLPAQEWRELCLASVTTHDLPPSAGYLTGSHVDLRERLDLLTRPAAEERAADEAERATWLAEVRRQTGLAEDTGEAGVEQVVEQLGLGPLGGDGRPVHLRADRVVPQEQPLGPHHLHHLERGGVPGPPPGPERDVDLADGARPEPAHLG